MDPGMAAVQPSTTPRSEIYSPSSSLTASSHRSTLASSTPRNPSSPDSSPASTPIATFSRLATAQTHRAKKRTAERTEYEAPPSKKSQRRPQEKPEISVVDLDVQDEWESEFIADLGTRCNQAPKDGCPLCYVFHCSRYKPGRSHQEYQLRAFSYLKSSTTISYNLCYNIHKENDIVCLGVVPASCNRQIFRQAANEAGHLFCLGKTQPKKALFTPRVVAQSPNFSQIKEWLDFCTSCHTLCHDNTDEVVGLKLIDCETELIVTAPQNPVYVALSYVWGHKPIAAAHAPTGQGQSQICSQKFSKTIRDAVLVTKELGYQYLWVDKFCIDQNNATEKHQQISRMDAIYQAAKLTIIASSGSNAQSGIPGINNTPRSSQPVAKCGEFRILSTMAHPHQQIPTSHWASRGWTLQEAVLSRRRLVFTEEQVYFECRTMNCCESLNPNLELTHKQSRDATFACFHSGILSGNTSNCFVNWKPDKFNAMTFHMNNYKELLLQYSKRNLSFEDDRLNAFTGIIKNFDRNTDTLQLWGVPYFRQSSIRPLYLSFASSLLWAHEERPEDDIALNRSGGGLIPSWSWARWGKEVQFPQGSGLIIPTVHRIRLEFMANSSVDFHDYLRTTKGYPPGTMPMYASQPKALLLDVPVVLPSKFKLHGRDDSVCVEWKRTEWYLSYGPKEPKALLELFQQRKFELVLLTRYHSLGFLVIENHQDFALRVGMCIVVFSTTQDDENWVEEISQKRTIRLK